MDRCHERGVPADRLTAVGWDTVVASEKDNASFFWQGGGGRPWWSNPLPGGKIATSVGSVGGEGTAVTSEADRQLVRTFVRESLEAIRRVQPLVRALVAQSDREELLPRITVPCFRLVHSVKGTGSMLGFDHLAAPAEAMEYLLDRVRSGVLRLTPGRIALLAETCTFLEQGLALVAAEDSDARLAASAAALASAIRLAASAEAEAEPGGSTAATLSADMRESFLWETNNLLTTAEQECVLWDFIAVDPERVATLCRLLHRLKQSFALYDFHDPERICLAMASTLNRYLQGDFFQTEYPERVLLRSIDAIRAAIARFPLTGELTVADVEHHLAAIQGMMRQPIGELLIEAGLVDPETVDQALKVQRSSVDAQPRRLGEVLVAMGEVTPEQVQDILREQHGKRTRTQEAEATLGGGGMARPEPSLTLFAPHEVCIDSRRLERMSVVLKRLLAMPLPDESLALLAEVQTLLRSCHRDALASLAGRLQRVVHDLSVQGNKRVQCTIEGIELLGETGEAVVLAEGLLHLIRNGVEHGLESVEERVRSGKRQTGTLHLLVLRQEEEIWISVEDDGRGFDFEQVAALLVRRGLATKDSIGGMSNRERMQHLFMEPPVARDRGQATGNQGPGLVVVNRMLTRIHGKINVTTRAGKGTCVTLRVPRNR